MARDTSPNRKHGGRPLETPGPGLEPRPPARRPRDTAQAADAAPLRVDGAIMVFTTRQHGVVTRAQLIGAGATAREVEHRVTGGRLIPVHRGVYRVGPVTAPRAAEMAAVLACGRAAFVSHRSAARLQEMLSAAGAPLEVTVRGRERTRPGLVVYTVRALPQDEVTRLDGIPITTPARTLIDLAAVLGARELERALAQADRRGLANPSQIHALLERYPRRPGTATLRALLLRDAAPAFTRSEAEERFLDLVEEAGLDRPEVNVDVGEYEVDFLWRKERIIAEVDGAAYHASTGSFERDRLRDMVLSAKGFHPVRVTWRQITEQRTATAVRVGQALARAEALLRLR